MSVKPQYLEKILNGEKTVEIRKSIPNCVLPIDVYLYCTKGKGSDKNPVLCSIVSFDYDEKTQKFINKDIEFGLNVWKTLPPHFGILDGKVVAKFTMNKIGDIYYYDEQEPDEIYNDTLECYELDYSKCAVGYMITKLDLNKMCLTYDELEKYGKGKTLYAWHIDNLKILDKPMELSDFKIANKELQQYGAFGWALDNQSNFISLTKAPQSWCYSYIKK